MKKEKKAGSFNKGLLFMKKIFLSSLIALFVSMVFVDVFGSTDSINIEAFVSPEKATVGAMIYYTIVISGSEPGNYDLLIPSEKTFFPDKKDTDSKGEKYVPLYVIGDVSRKEFEKGDFGLSEIKVEITYYRTGEYGLPVFKITDKAGNEYSYKAPEVEIESINKESTLADIESPLSLSGNYIRLYLLILAVLISGILIYFLIKFFRKKKANDIQEEIPILSPFELFMADLKKIDCLKLISDGKVKEYVFAISILFRKYISALYEFDAAEMTTEEISRVLVSVMPVYYYRQYNSEIIDIMNFWDLSKFAEFSPSNELLMNNYNSILSVAQKLSPHEERNNG